MRKCLIISFLTLIVFIFLPSIASTRLAKPLFVRALEAKTQSHVEIGALKLSWFGPQSFKEIRWSRDQVSSSIEELQIQAPFWSFSGAFQLKNGSVAYKSGLIQQIEGQIVDHDFALTGITLEGHISVKGQIYSKFHFNLAIDITLQDPLIATLRLTPNLSALLLKDANPLFFTGLEAKNPITVMLHPEHTSIPIPFSLDQFKAKGTLELGQVQCQNGKSLATIIALLKAAPLSEAKQMNGWFTPIDFQVEKGIVTTGRMDALLADSIHICSWGDIDLLSDKLYMTIGLPADTLESAFGIHNLPEDYVLTVDVRGTTKEPEILKGPAIAKITALIAAEQIPKKSVLGSITELFKKPQRDNDVPPAKHPFLWENQQ